MLEVPAAEIQRIIDTALEEDLGWGDITTDALVPPEAQASARVVFKSGGVIAGLKVLERVFETVDPDVRIRHLRQDGDVVPAKTAVAEVSGRAASMLKAERVALNFIQKLSGIATETRRYVEAVEGTPARIIHTRKTTPGLRALERYAVVCGGGHLHRYNLADGVLIKDNHLAWTRQSGKSTKEALAMVRRRIPHTMTIEIEVETVEEAREAAEAGAEVILLDNMSPEEMRRAVEAVAGRARTEASGGITLANVRAVAEAGVDLISIGALTHSVKALDVGLEAVE